MTAKPVEVMLLCARFRLRIVLLEQLPAVSKIVKTFLKSEADQVVRYAQRSGYALKRVMARVCHVVLDINAIEVGQLTADFLERKTSWIPRQL
ncbi:hypothetical protein ACHAXM_006296 [Skeletonema potamos]